MVYDLELAQDWILGILLGYPYAAIGKSSVLVTLGHQVYKVSRV
jgi:hypothetical protein